MRYEEYEGRHDEIEEETEDICPEWSEYQRKYREAHREEIRARNRMNYYKHREERLEAGRKYREKKRRERDGIDTVVDFIGNSDCYSKVD